MRIENMKLQPIQFQRGIIENMRFISPGEILAVLSLHMAVTRSQRSHKKTAGLYVQLEIEMLCAWETARQGWRYENVPCPQPSLLHSSRQSGPIEGPSLGRPTWEGTSCLQPPRHLPHHCVHRLCTNCHTIPYIEHFFWPEPWLTVVHFIGNRVPFETLAESTILELSYRLTLPLEGKRGKIEKQGISHI